MTIHQFVKPKGFLVALTLLRNPIIFATVLTADSFAIIVCVNNQIVFESSQ